jgi:acyl carrier protein
VTFWRKAKYDKVEYLTVEIAFCAYNATSLILAILEQSLNTEEDVLSILDEILSLNGRTAEFSRNTPLLGAIPELDSMAVVALITSFEDHLGITVDDDEIDGSTFATVGSLIDFVAGKLAG